MNRRSTHLGDSVNGLDAWDAEGGGQVGAPAPDTPAIRRRAAPDKELLRRLGTALIGEWSELAMPLQRALYERAVRDHSGSGTPSLKRRMACLLHDHHHRHDGC